MKMRYINSKIVINLWGQNIQNPSFLFFCHSHYARYICTRKTIALKESRYSGLLSGHVKKIYVTEMAKLSEKLYLLSRKWLAIYSRPRWEKKVTQLLTEKGLECYCPLNKVRRKWSDRVKIVEEPLFKSYVFVRVNDEDRTAVRMTPGVINFVYWNGKPALVKEKEINAIKQFLNEYENVEVKPIELILNQRVKITKGPLMDQEGKVMELHRKTVKVAIDSLGYMLIAYIDRSKLSSSE